MILFEMIFFFAQGGPAETVSVILLILLAIIAAALIFIGYTIWSAWGWWKGSGSSSGPSQAGRDALTELQTIITTIVEAKRNPSADECTEMRRLIDAARSGGIPSVTIDAMVTEVNKLCP
jgi:hypothetical protein